MSLIRIPKHLAVLGNSAELIPLLPIPTPSPSLYELAYGVGEPTSAGSKPKFALGKCFAPYVDSFYIWAPYERQIASELFDTVNTLHVI